MEVTVYNFLSEDEPGLKLSQVINIALKVLEVQEVTLFNFAEQPVLIQIPRHHNIPERSYGGNMPLIVLDIPNITGYQEDPQNFVDDLYNLLKPKFWSSNPGFQIVGRQQNWHQGPSNDGEAMTWISNELYVNN